jgi:hypothetical protein
MLREGHGDEPTAMEYLTSIPYQNPKMRTMLMRLALLEVVDENFDDSLIYAETIVVDTQDPNLIDDLLDAGYVEVGP